jgi:hypothetical protein
MKTAYVLFEVVRGVAQVEQPVRGNDGVEVWEVLPTRRAEFGRWRDGWIWMRRSYFHDRDMEGVPLGELILSGIHGPFPSEREAREDMEALGAVRASVHWPTIGDPIRGFVTKPPKEYEAGYVEMIELARDQWSVVKGTQEALGSA